MAKKTTKNTKKAAPASKPMAEMMKPAMDNDKNGCSCSSCWCWCGPFTLTFLRVLVGFAFIMHGIGKVGADFGFTLFKYGSFGGIALPAWLTSVVGVLEVAIGALLILGLWTFWAGKGMATIMTVAVFGVHLMGGFGKDFFYPMLFLAAGLVLAHQGPGAWALDNKFGRCCDSGCGCD
jgi:uncharacterized membrane protein YphA (DoxX/SURF4 family)